MRRPDTRPARHDRRSETGDLRIPRRRHRRISARAAQCRRHFSLTVNHRSSTPLIGARECAVRAQRRRICQMRRSVSGCSSGAGGRDAVQFDGRTLARPLAIHRFADDENRLGSRRARHRGLRRPHRRDAQRLRYAIGTRHVRREISPCSRDERASRCVRRRLIARGVPCAGSGRGNVLHRRSRATWNSCCTAVLHVEDENALRGALCTALLGATLRDVRQWQTTKRRRSISNWSDSRPGMRSRVSRGVQALIETMSAERAAAIARSRRRRTIVTDLRHLGELLASDDDASTDSNRACARLAALRPRDVGDDDVRDRRPRQLRIESDAARVQLMTVHGAKGLQFPIVFLPFAWRVRTHRRTRAENPALP